MKSQSTIAYLLAVFCGAAIAAPAAADIDLSLQTTTPSVQVGDTVSVEVVVTSDSSNDQLLSAVQMIFGWQTPYLQLIGLNQTGAVPLLSSSFPTGDPYGLNESDPPQDGEGLYQAYAPLGDPVAATPTGTLLTTMEFLALSPVNETAIDILTSAGDPVGETVVFDGTQPNNDITGLITGTTVQIVPGPAGLAALCIGLVTGSIGHRRRRRESTSL